MTTKGQYEEKRAYGVGLCHFLAQWFLPGFCLVCACFCAVLRCSKCRFIVSYIGNNNILFVTILCLIWARFLWIGRRFALALGCPGWGAVFVAVGNRGGLGPWRCGAWVVGVGSVGLRGCSVACRGRGSQGVRAVPALSFRGAPCGVLGGDILRRCFVAWSNSKTALIAPYLLPLRRGL